MTVDLKNITFEDNYLHCHFEGHFKILNKMIEHGRLILKAYKETNCPNVILDFSIITGQIGVITEHTLGEFISKMIPQKVRIAVIAPSHMKSTASGHLETVVANRSGRLKVCWKLEEAVEWLRASAKTTSH